MDPRSNYSSINPTYLDFPLSSAQAQQFLQHIGWTYYTIWEKDTISPLCSAPRLAWRTGDVNRSLLADQINLYKPISELITGGNRLDRQQINKACKMGDILQQFYKYCGFLPWGLGIAGMALANGQYRWASGEQLFEQISLLAGAYKPQPVPLDLAQGHFFKTVVCIPLPNGAGVLEMGTKALVPEGDGCILSQMLAFIDGLAAGGITHMREEKILNSALNSGMPYKGGQHIQYDEYGEAGEHNEYKLKVMQMYGGRVCFRQSSKSSSSSSGATSPLSADHQKGSGSITSTTSPTSLQASSINQLEILNQLGHIGLHPSSISTPISTMPALCNQHLNTNVDQHLASLPASQDNFYSSPPALSLSATLCIAKHEYINMPQGVALDHYINMQQTSACSADDQSMNTQHYTARTISAPGAAVPRYTGFRRWSGSLSAISYQRRQKTAAKDSFLKKLLTSYLPKHRGLTVRSGPMMQNVGGTSGLLQEQEFTQDDHTSSTQMNEAALNHMYAERNRRRKQAECYRGLRTLVPNITKKDKVGTLERSIEYLKELKDRVRELEHAKDALIYMNSEDRKDVVRNSSQHTSSHAIARCSYLPPSIVKDGNYFQLNVKRITKHEEVNMTNVAVLRALLKKKLHCMKFKSEFQKSNGKFEIDILAKYKDGENYTLSLDVIQEIEEWWPKAMKDL